MKPYEQVILNLHCLGQDYIDAAFLDAKEGDIHMTIRHPLISEGETKTVTDKEEIKRIVCELIDNT